MLFAKIRHHVSPKVLSIITIGIVVGSLSLFAQSSSLTFTVTAEEAAMLRLAETKQTVTLVEFATDGCSGSVSSGWTNVVSALSSISESFAESYQNADNVPFEAACVVHDRAYHEGSGGYAGRLRADNQLRADIIEYGIANTDDIKLRTGITSDAQIIHLYEVLAEAVYRGVRIGGAPCTGQPYAWGYGYGSGECAVIE